MHHNADIIVHTSAEIFSVVNACAKQKTDVQKHRCRCKRIALNIDYLDPAIIRFIRLQRPLSE